jgi:hypothetical protein
MISAIDSISIPFYPRDTLSDEKRAMLADNLSFVARGQFRPLVAYVSKVTSADGRLKNYIFHGATKKTQ